MQLVAYGAQDIYLTGNPQITFFKVVYRRHTNFSIESIEQTFNGSIAFGNRVSCTISREGDLVHKMYIQYKPSDIVDVGANSGAVFPKLPCGLLKEVNIEIGGQEIDRHYSHWYSAREDLFEDEIGFAGMSDGQGTKVWNYYQSAYYGSIQSVIPMANSKYAIVTGSTRGCKPKAWAVKGEAEHYYPLQFWFNRNVGLALPLIALQYHEVKINWTLPSAGELGTAVGDGNGTGPTQAAITGTNLNNIKLFADYIYLDTDERRRFAQVSHEYLIEQLQYEEHSSSSALTLNFNHPVKELIWGAVPNDRLATSSAQLDQDATSLPADVGYGNSNGDRGYSKLTSFRKLCGRQGSFATPDGDDFNITLKLNGHERFAPRPITYFSRQQVYDYHTGLGDLLEQDSLCVYSFALKPEEHQPSGTCNFSRIDSAILQFNKSPHGDSVGTGENGNGQPPDSIRVYAINYNVLRIMSGMGGLAYSN